jgi:hypothetical protein
MSNYVQSTNFATKDALPSGDPLKIVKGTEINTEFNNIATAVATKADTASPTLTSPTLVTPALGTPTSGVMTNVTGLPIDGGTTGTLSVARGGTGVTTSTGTGNNVLSNSPTLITPALGTPSAAVLTNATGLPIVAGTTGTLPVARGGTGVTTSTGTGNVVLSASPTFTGTPAAPTASVSTNTTQIATTAFVQAALQALHPVGSIYINAGVTTNPATLLGFGTWVAFGAGRVMVGLNAGDALFDTLEETGGSKDAIVVSHSHTASSSSSSYFSGNALPTHTHAYPFADGGVGTVKNAVAGFNSSGAAATSAVSGGTPSGSVSTSTSTTVNAAGSSATNANLQPYITVAMWKRTA